MKGYVANTDFDWYSFLQAQPGLTEVNFWQPSGGRAFHAIQPGEIFFFKLKRPYYAVAGFGVFARHTVLPAWLAWESFKEANGAPDFDAMRRRIEKYRSPSDRSPNASYQIGCLLVAEPVFFDRDAWLPQPRDWGAQTVQGKTYDLATDEGRRLWDACRERVQRSEIGAASQLMDTDAPRFGAERLVKPRLGQGIFRVAVLDAYGRSCAVTTEHSLPTLEAGHIRPYAKGGEHEISNGILMRRDIHSLFDLGYVTITADDLRFEVSQRLREEWDNGRAYYAMRGKHIHTPAIDADRPNRELLSWHNSEVFLGQNAP